MKSFATVESDQIRPVEKLQIFERARMPRTTFTSLFVLLFAVVLVSTATGADRPSIVLIITDDMGFSDLGGYGSEIETPQIDRLAASGVRFSELYNLRRHSNECEVETNC